MRASSSSLWRMARISRRTLIRSSFWFLAEVMSEIDGSPPLLVRVRRRW